MSEEQLFQVPAKAKHQVKIIVEKNKEDLERKTNDFLETISDEKRLISIVFAVNMKTGELIQVINYAKISPMSPEEWVKKQENQKKFTKGFVPENLMSSGEKITKL